MFLRGLGIPIIPDVAGNEVRDRIIGGGEASPTLVVPVKGVILLSGGSACLTGRVPA